VVSGVVGPSIDITVRHSKFRHLEERMGKGMENSNALSATTVLRQNRNLLPVVVAVAVDVPPIDSIDPF